MVQKTLKRVQLDMSEESLKFLDSLKEKSQSASRAEVIKDAIFYYNLIVDSVIDDNTVLIKDKSGKEQPIILPIIR